MKNDLRPVRGVRRRSLATTVLLLLLFLAALPLHARAEDTQRHPLQPPDTSSPRDTLKSFLANLDEAHAAVQKDRIEEVAAPMRRARRCLDLSEIPPRLAENVGIETTLLLKEVLDRIALPDLAGVPGAGELEERDLKKWTVPHTEITIARVEDGPREGEFLFDAETVERAKEFYRRARHLPYKPGAAEGIYEAYILTPGRGIDPGWTRIFPDWASVAIFEQAAWQWIGMFLVLMLAALVTVAVYRLGRRLDGRRSSDAVFEAGRILAVGFALAAVFLADTIIDSYINVTGEVLQFTKEALTLVSHGLTGWLAVLVINRIPEAIISSRHLIPRGVDSQLLRLGFRLLTFIVLAGLLMDAADELGLPAYSVLTGFGVGGLAVALAARETLANFLGSIIIMWDRPYRVGDWIVVGDKEGTVEDIGFRSTRIRTFYDSVLSIPNSDTVNATVDNMGRRRYRRIRTFVSITYDTPAEKVETFLEGIKNIIRANETTRKDYFNVVLHDLGGHSLEIMLYFFVKVPDYASELVQRQRILLEVIRLAEAMAIRLALPTQTIQVESFPGTPSEAPAQVSAGESLQSIAEDFGPEGRRARPQGSGLFKPPHEEEGAKGSG